MTTEFLRERTFEVNGLQIACKEWGRSGFTPIIALHGWLDNAASFDHLIPLMNNVHVIALDMMGHGKSSHRSADSFYEPWIDVGDVISVADQMLWDEFTLLGHSRGAIISAFVAGTFPERIKNLFLIDGYVPYLHTPQKNLEIILKERLRKIEDLVLPRLPIFVILKELCMLELKVSFRLHTKLRLRLQKGVSSRMRMDFSGVMISD